MKTPLVFWVEMWFCVLALKEKDSFSQVLVLTLSVCWSVTQSSFFWENNFGRSVFLISCRRQELCVLDTLPLGQHDRVDHHVGLMMIYLASVLKASSSILGYGAALGGQYRHNNNRLS